jgi:endonuclease G
MRKRLLLLLLWLPFFGEAQDLDVEIVAVNQELNELKAHQEAVYAKLEDLKLQRIQRDLRAVGLPSDGAVFHSAMALEYAEEHEQARWVAHIILPDIIEGAVTRTNDFRPDPKVPTGTAVEEDYFLKYLQPDSSYEYDGFGYDRGHLAPSADFRWSKRALSESYYYSNMSPQAPEFNREAWAELESLLRAYLYEHPETQLYVVTGGLLEDDLPYIERSVNKVSIPQAYFKVALDLKNETAIGFIMPNQQITYPLESFAVSVDEVEALTGLDFFRNLPDDQEARLEASLDKPRWIPELANGDVEPIYPPALPAGHFNTVQAGQYVGKGEEIKVCGTVVSTRYSRSGNLWMNVDKQFPNQIFSVFIRKKDLANFSYDPAVELQKQQVCFTGVVENFNGAPTMNLTREEALSFEVRLK